MTYYHLLKRSSSCPVDSKSLLPSADQEHSSKQWQISPDSVFLFPQSPGYKKRRSKQHSNGKKCVSFREEPFQRIRSLRTNEDLPTTWYSVRDSHSFNILCVPLQTIQPLSTCSSLSCPSFAFTDTNSERKSKQYTWTSDES